MEMECNNQRITNLLEKSELGHHSSIALQMAVMQEKNWYLILIVGYSFNQEIWRIEQKGILQVQPQISNYIISETYTLIFKLLTNNIRQLSSYFIQKGGKWHRQDNNNNEKLVQFKW